MKLDHVFLAFMAVCGIVAGGVLFAAPQSARFVIPPYFWLLIAMLAFEGLVYWRFGGNLGSLISMEFRLIGLLIGIAVMFAIPYVAGAPVSLL
ncbi:MAG: hypothetical protein AB1490_15355 [Pseudomonadota bacterium]